jgi:hypothetical protein
MLPTIDMKTVYDDRREDFTTRAIASFAIFLLALGAVPLAAPAQARSQKPTMPLGGTGAQPFSAITAQIPGPLLISFGSHSAEWTQAALAALPHQTVTVYNEHTKAQETYSGVPLIGLLAPLALILFT